MRGSVLGEIEKICDCLLFKQDNPGHCILTDIYKKM